jgi:DHA1 family inner membrane transport protein
MGVETTTAPLSGATATRRVAVLAMFAILLLSYVVNAMDRQVFSLLAADVRKEYGFSLADIGLLSTIFTLGMAVAGWPTGYLLARFSHKAVLQVGIAIFSIGTVLTAFAVGMTDMLIYRAATGVGEAMQLTALIAITAKIFVRYRTVAMGSINIAFGIGGVVGPLLASAVLGAYGNWRGPVTLFGLIGFVAMALIAVAVSTTPSAAPQQADEVRGNGGARTLANRNTVILIALSIIAGLIIYGYFGMYPTFLREYLHFSPADTGHIMGIHGIGVLCSLIGAWLGDRYSPRAVLGVAFLVAAVLGYLLLSFTQSFAGQAVLSFCWGFTVSGTIFVNLASSHMKAVVPELTSRASGVFVSCLYSAATFAGYLIGFLAGKLGWDHAGLIQMSTLSALGALLCLGLKLKAVSRTV